MIGDGCLRHVKVRGYVSGREPAVFQHLQYFAAYRRGLLEEVPAGVDTDAGEYQQEMMLAANVSKENPSGGADDTFEESGAATDGGTDVPEPDGGTDDTAEESSSEGEDTGNN